MPQRQAHQKHLLASIASISAGFAFRERVKPDPAGEVAVVQMRDLEQGYTSIRTDLVKVSAEGIPTRYHLLRGDVLFLAKGQNNVALVYDQDLPFAVASAVFFVIRPDHKRVDSHYLAWAINQEPAQQYLHERMAGTYITSINRPTLEGLEVTLLPLPQQQLIASVHALAVAEQRILTDIASKRNLLVQRLLLTSIPS